MTRLPVLSGKELVKILCKNFGFIVHRQGKGSHLLLRGERNGKIKIFPVPMHPEVSKGTLRDILKEAEISREEFEKALR